MTTKLPNDTPITPETCKTNKTTDKIEADNHNKLMHAMNGNQNLTNIIQMHSPRKELRIK